MLAAISSMPGPRPYFTGEVVFPTKLSSAMGRLLFFRVWTTCVVRRASLFIGFVSAGSGYYCGLFRGCQVVFTLPR